MYGQLVQSIGNKPSNWVAKPSTIHKMSQGQSLFLLFQSLQRQWQWIPTSSSSDRITKGLLDLWHRDMATETNFFIFFWMLFLFWILFELLRYSIVKAEWAESDRQLKLLWFLQSSDSQSWQLQDSAFGGGIWLGGATWRPPWCHSHSKEHRIVSVRRGATTASWHSDSTVVLLFKVEKECEGGLAFYWFSAFDLLTRWKRFPIPSRCGILTTNLSK